MATRRKTSKKKTKARTTRTTRTATRTSASALEDKPRTKSQIFSDISDKTGLSRKDIAGVFDAMVDLIKRDLGRRGPGQFTVPGLMKIVKVHKPRRAARKNVPNPFRPGEFMDVPAKPASNVVKVRPLKNLKEMV